MGMLLLEMGEKYAYIKRRNTKYDGAIFIFLSFYSFLHVV